MAVEYKAHARTPEPVCLRVRGHYPPTTSGCMAVVSEVLVAHVPGVLADCIVKFLASFAVRYVVRHDLRTHDGYCTDASEDHTASCSFVDCYPRTWLCSFQTFAALTDTLSFHHLCDGDQEFHTSWKECEGSGYCDVDCETTLVRWERVVVPLDEIDDCRQDTEFVKKWCAQRYDSWRSEKNHSFHQ